MQPDKARQSDNERERERNKRDEKKNVDVKRRWVCGFNEIVAAFKSSD